MLLFLSATKDGPTVRTTVMLELTYYVLLLVASTSTLDPPHSTCTLVQPGGGLAVET
jgi:hypothetical protein